MDRNAENSIFQYYKSLVALRKQYPVIQSGTVIPLLQEDDQILAYERKLGNEELYVFCNFFGKETRAAYQLPEGCKAILSNYKDSPNPSDLVLRPYEAVIFYKKG